MKFLTHTSENGTGFAQEIERNAGRVLLNTAFISVTRGFQKNERALDRLSRQSLAEANFRLEGIQLGSGGRSDAYKDIVNSSATCFV